MENQNTNQKFEKLYNDLRSKVFKYTSKKYIFPGAKFLCDATRVVEGGVSTVIIPFTHQIVLQDNSSLKLTLYNFYVLAFGYASPTSLSIPWYKANREYLFNIQAQYREEEYASLTEINVYGVSIGTILMQYMIGDLCSNHAFFNKFKKLKLINYHLVGNSSIQSVTAQEIGNIINRFHLHCPKIKLKITVMHDYNDNLIGTSDSYICNDYYDSDVFEFFIISKKTPKNNQGIINVSHANYKNKFAIKNGDFVYHGQKAAIMFMSLLTSQSIRGNSNASHFVSSQFDAFADTAPNPIKAFFLFNVVEKLGFVQDFFIRSLGLNYIQFYDEQPIKSSPFYQNLILLLTGALTFIIAPILFIIIPSASFLFMVSKYYVAYEAIKHYKIILFATQKVLPIIESTIHKVLPIIEKIASVFKQLKHFF